jgi:glutamyl-tRNA synthetase
LYARHTGGKFLLRIEDTDRERSSEQAISAIFESLSWLELKWDGPPVFQFSRAKYHAAVAHQLIQKGLAYYCYCSVPELEQMRAAAIAKGLPPRYNGRWRECGETPPAGVAPVIRFKAPQSGQTIIHDLVQGPVKLENSQLDDMVLLRADGTPTYMLSVVVDDHDMGITHVIRGDDHLTNMFRQYHLFKACEWNVPEFAHIPLIHGPDGSKLSKRHGDLGAEQYKEAGFLPEAMRNYLLRLGWAHGNDEVISIQQAIEWFDIRNVGRSPARFDLKKLLNLNGCYIKRRDNQHLMEMILPMLSTENQTLVNRVEKGLNSLKQRAKTINELAANALFYVERPTYTKGEQLEGSSSSQTRSFANRQSVSFLNQIVQLIENAPDLEEHSMEAAIRDFCKINDVKLNELLTPARIALTGSNFSPSLFEIMNILEKGETVLRLKNYACFLSGL